VIAAGVGMGLGGRTATFLAAALVRRRRVILLPIEGLQRDRLGAPVAALAGVAREQRRATDVVPLFSSPLPSAGFSFFADQLSLHGILAPSHHMEVPPPLLQGGQSPARRALVQHVARVVHEREPREGWRAPHELESDSGPKLHVCNVSWWLLVTPDHAGAPRAPWSVLRQRGQLDSIPQGVSEGDTFYSAFVFVVTLLAPHGSQVAVVKVVEGVACVALAWLRMRKIF
jgi:hypothetical protein